MQPVESQKPTQKNIDIPCRPEGEIQTRHLENKHTICANQGMMWKNIANQIYAPGGEPFPKNPTDTARQIARFYSEKNGLPALSPRQKPPEYLLKLGKLAYDLRETTGMLWTKIGRLHFEQHAWPQHSARYAAKTYAHHTKKTWPIVIKFFHQKKTIQIETGKRQKKAISLRLQGVTWNHIGIRLWGNSNNPAVSAESSVKAWCNKTGHSIPYKYPRKRKLNNLSHLLAIS